MLWMLRLVAIVVGVLMLRGVGRGEEEALADLLIPLLFLVVCWRLLLLRRWAAFVTAFCCVANVLALECEESLFSPLGAATVVFTTAVVVSTTCTWQGLKSGF